MLYAEGLIPGLHGLVAVPASFPSSPSAVTLSLPSVSAMNNIHRDKSGRYGRRRYVSLGE